MTSTEYEQLRETSLLSNSDIERRVGELIGRAEAESLWFLMLDEHRVQLPPMVSFDVEGIDTRDERELGANNFAFALAATEVGSVVTVIERPGDRNFTASDKDWASVVSAACRTAQLPLAGVLISHDDGVRWFAPDDYE